ncbi:phosphatase PAP2 family protein [Streptomyces sp. NPDC048330]|uniref:phosphatase PAP2 family protein n=1 Tax=Streptomyces sp. NPDC048330 TaxID=3365533 RepID=UPI00371BBC6B
MDFLGEPVGAVVLVVAAALGLLVARRPRGVVVLVVGVGVAVGATKVLKSVVGRTIHDGSLSYPSGHTAFLTAFALVVAVVVGARPAGVWAAGIVAGGVMGWAQVLLDAHYPTDVVGGWCTAVAVVPVVAWAVDRVADRTADVGRAARR